MSSSIIFDNREVLISEFSTIYNALLASGKEMGFDSIYQKMRDLFSVITEQALEKRELELRTRTIKSIDDVTDQSSALKSVDKIIEIRNQFDLKGAVANKKQELEQEGYN